ncbi:MAG: NADPH-dependent FMN reductase [Brumimicrobium sp.]|nr:NADPH-dependent FMN reductase [Brumimicrobium sp.]
MKIIGFAGSNSSTSINKQLVNYTLNLIENHQKILLDLNDFEIPMFSVDIEKSIGYPEKVKEFVNILATADALVISLAEHNGAYTAVFKNLMDWCSRYELKFFGNKPIFLMSTSPGGYGAGNSMELGLSRFPKFGADIVSHFSLPKFNENFSKDQGITDIELREKHVAELNVFLKKVHAPAEK